MCVLVAVAFPSCQEESRGELRFVIWSRSPLGFALLSCCGRLRFSVQLDKTAVSWQRWSCPFEPRARVVCYGLKRTCDTHPRLVCSHSKARVALCMKICRSVLTEDTSNTRGVAMRELSTVRHPSTSNTDASLVHWMSHSYLELTSRGDEE